jgi:hypothetical protein
VSKRNDYKKVLFEVRAKVTIVSMIHIGVKYSCITT